MQKNPLSLAAESICTIAIRPEEIKPIKLFQGDKKCRPFVLKRFGGGWAEEVVSVKRHQELLHVTQGQFHMAPRQTCHCAKLSPSVTLMAEQVEMP